MAIEVHLETNCCRKYGYGILKLPHYLQANNEYFIDSYQDAIEYACNILDSESHLLQCDINTQVFSM